ncbi:hydroxyacid dehydrogenase, partial [Patescibacteria group bacterium]
HSMNARSHQIVLGNLLLAQHENVIVTPHNAFNSHEALWRILDTTVKNIKSFYKGKSINIVKNN